MSKLSLKEKVLYGVLALMGSASLYGMFITSTTFYKQRGNSDNPPSTQAHDKTGSDSHQGTNQAIGEVIDLTAQSVVAMDIKDMRYARPNIKIKKGTTVTWTNQDTVKHNVMQEHSDSSSAHDAPLPGEVKSNVFAGPLLAKGESYSYTFNEVGTDPYHCSPHPYMKGSVTVVD